MKNEINNDDFLLYFQQDGVPFTISVEKEFIKIVGKKKIALFDGFNNKLGELNVEDIKHLQSAWMISLNKKYSLQEFFDSCNNDTNKKQWLEKILGFRPWRMLLESDSNKNKIEQCFTLENYNKENEKKENKHIYLNYKYPQILIRELDIINNKLIADGNDRYKQQNEKNNKTLTKIFNLFNDQYSKINKDVMNIVKQKVEEDKQDNVKQEYLSFKLQNNLYNISNKDLEKKFDTDIEQEQKDIFKEVFKENVFFKDNFDNGLVQENKCKNYKTEMHKIPMKNNFSEIDTDIIVNLVNNDEKIKEEIIDEIYGELSTRIDNLDYSKAPKPEDVIKYIKDNFSANKNKNKSGISFDFNKNYGTDLTFDNIFYNYSIQDEQKQAELEKLLKEMDCDLFLRENGKNFSRQNLMNVFEVEKEHINREVQKLTKQNNGIKLAKAIICEQDDEPDNDDYSDNLKSLYYHTLFLALNYLISDNY